MPNLGRKHWNIEQHGSLGNGYPFTGQRWGTDPGKLIGLPIRKLRLEKELRFPSKNSILLYTPSISLFFCCAYQIQDPHAVHVVPTLQCKPSKHLIHAVKGSVSVVVCQNLTHEIYTVAGSKSILYVSHIQKI